MYYDTNNVFYVQENQLYLFFFYIALQDQDFIKQKKMSTTA